MTAQIVQLQPSDGIDTCRQNTYGWTGADKLRLIVKLIIDMKHCDLMT